MELVRKTLTGEAQDKGEGVVVAVISTPSVDRDGDVVEPGGLVADRFMRNPVVLWMHKPDSPIGKCEEIKVTEEGVVATVRFDLNDPFAKLLYEKYKAGFLRAWSVGFIPLEWEPTQEGGRRYKKWELYEFSAVTVPANPEALTVEVRAALEKAVVPFQDYPLDMDSAWDAAKARAQLRKWASKDGSGDKDTIDWAKYRRGFVWYDQSNPENFGSYKLPIAYVKGGKPVAVWRGVVAAMAAVLGARGGVDIPAADRRRAYEHLAKYYRKAGKEPPEFRVYPSVEEVPVRYPEEAEAILEIIEGKEVF